MIVFYWIAGGLFALTALPAAGFFLAYILTGEDAFQERAVAFYRWAVTVALATFNVTLYKYVILAFLALWRS